MYCRYEKRTCPNHEVTEGPDQAEWTNSSSNRGVKKNFARLKLSIELNTANLEGTPEKEARLGRRYSTAENQSST